MLDFLLGYVMGERTASRAAAFSRDAGLAAVADRAHEAENINDRINRLVLVVDALWSILREQGYSDEQLQARIEEIDAEDGVLDGLRTPRPSRCPSCDSMVEAGRETCAFCGHVMSVRRQPLTGL